MYANWETLMTDKEEEFILDCIEKQVENTLSDDDAKKLDKLIIEDEESCTFYNDILRTLKHHLALQKSARSLSFSTSPLPIR